MPIGNLPPLLAGPILRRVEPDLVSVWIATLRSCNVSLLLYDGADVIARDQSGSSLKVRFTRVGDTIYGRIVGSPAPTVLVLERESQ